MPEFLSDTDDARLLAEERPGDNALALSVGELSFKLKRMVEGEFGHVRLRGEISGYKRATSGHVYLALKDDAAVIDGVMWKGQVNALAVIDLGRFAFPNVAPGEYTLVAGLGTPYPATYFPGVPNRELARTITVGPGEDAPPLQLTIPHPRRTRTLSLRIPQASNSFRLAPRIALIKGQLYEQKWSQSDRTITAVIDAAEPFTFRLSAWPHNTEFEISEEITLPAGNENISLPVPLFVPKK